MKVFTIIVLQFLLLNVIFASGFQYRKNYLTSWAGLGFSYLNTSENSLTDALPGAHLGLGYTWQYENNFFLTMGGEINALASYVYKQDQLSLSRNMVDNDASLYNTFVMNSTFDEFKEWDNVFFFNAVVFFGYRFESGTYMNLGAKVGYAPLSYSHSKTQLRNVADYGFFVTDLAAMPEHYLVKDKELKGTSKTKMGLNAVVSFEMGKELKLDNGRYDDILRLGFFVDYGLMNINNNTVSQSAVFSAKENPAAFDLHPYQTTNVATGSTMIPLYLGLKLSYYYCTKKVCSCLRKQGLSYKKSRRR